MPILKKPTAKQIESVKKPKFAEGDKVSFDLDGDTVEGVILEVEGKNATVEADGENYVCTFDELTLLEDEIPMEHKNDKPKKSSKLAKEEAGDDDDNDDDDDKKKKPGKSGKSAVGKSLASLYKKAKPAEDFVGLPVGKHDALITDAQLESGDTGTNVYFEYTAVGDEETAGMSSRGYYNVVDKDGEATRGLEFFKRDIAKLGFEDELEAANDDDGIQEVLDDMVKKLLWVSITVRPQKNDPTRNNIFLDGLHEDQDDKPELPEVE